MSEQIKYEVLSVQPQIYVSNGIPTNGYLVRILLLDWNEYDDFNVPNRNPDTIHRKAVEIVRDRERIGKLGTIGEDET